MKRLTPCILACLIVAPGVTLDQHFLLSAAAYAQVPWSGSTSLESTFVPQDSQYAVVLGQNGYEGQYRGQTLDSGVQLQGHTRGNGCGNAEFHLGGGYDQLDLVLSNEDTHSGPTIIIKDNSDSAHPKVLFRKDFILLAQVRTRVHVSGVQFITINEQVLGNDTYSCTAIDVQGTLTKGTAPIVHANQVVARYPTSNAGVPANSKVLFGWQPFPHATTYAFHIWVVGLRTIQLTHRDGDD